MDKLQDELQELQKLLSSTTSQMLQDLLAGEITKCKKMMEELKYSEQITKLRDDLRHVECISNPGRKQKLRYILNAEINKCQEQLSKCGLDSNDAESNATGNETGIPYLKIIELPSPLPATEPVIIEETSAHAQIKTTKTSRKEAPSKIYTVTIATYSWGQSNKYIKLYVALPGLCVGDEEKVTCEFEDRGMTLRINNFGRKNYNLVINNLAEKIVPKESSWNVKKEQIVILLHKGTLKLEWLAVTAVEADVLKKDKKERTQSHQHQKDVLQEQPAVLTSIARKPDVLDVIDQIRHVMENHDKMGMMEMFSRGPSFNFHLIITELEQHKISNMKESGIWIVESSTIASAAVAWFPSHPPRAVHVTFPPVLHPPQEFPELLKAAAKHPCELLMVMNDDEAKTTGIHDRDAAMLELVVNKRCVLVTFFGHLKEKDICNLPQSVYRVGLTIANAADAAAAAAFRPWLALGEMMLFVTRKLKVEDLQSLLWLVTFKLIIRFDLTKDRDVRWITDALVKMLAKRPFVLMMDKSLLTAVGARKLLKLLKSSSLNVKSVQITSMMISDDATKIELFNHYETFGCPLVIR